MYTDEQLINIWVELGSKNRWIANAVDPHFTARSFCKCESIQELAEKLEQGNWCLGQAFYYKNICLIQQVNGGNEWLVIRDNIVFESLTYTPAQFPMFMERILKASDAALKNLSY